MVISKLLPSAGISWQLDFFRDGNVRWVCLREARQVFLIHFNFSPTGFKIIFSAFAAQIHSGSYQQHPELPADAALPDTCACLLVNNRCMRENVCVCFFFFLKLRLIDPLSTRGMEECYICQQYCQQYCQLIIEGKSHHKSIMNMTKENNKCLFLQ